MSDDDDWAEEAAELERMFVRRSEPYQEVLADTMLGERRLSWAGASVFCKKLEQRMSATLDPDGTTRQKQSVIQVGCSGNLDRRMNDHEPLADLSRSSHSWALLCSCLKKLKIRFESVCLPIVKVWKPDQLKLAEIMVTMLSGSMIWDGGLNEVQPGGRAARADPGKFGEALKQIFIHKSWTTDNLNESEKKLQARIEALEVYQDLDNWENGIESTINKSLAEISAIQSLALKTRIAISQAAKEEVHARDQLKTTLVEMREVAVLQSEWLDLHQRLLRWQKGEEDGNTSEGTLEKPGAGSA